MSGLTTLVALFLAAFSTAKPPVDRVEAVHRRPAGVNQHTSGDSTILNFDDIPTAKGFASIPSPYHQLAFSSFDVIKPGDPNLVDRISPHDINCAVSSPNALIGSRDPSGLVASFEIGNTTAVEAEFTPSFDLVTFYLKPMDAPPPGTTVFVKGYSDSREEALEWHVTFTTGYHLPLLVKLEEYSREPWDQLHKVEIWAEYGEDALDWEFCIDDLEVKFYGYERRYRVTEQVVLGGGMEA